VVIQKIFIFLLCGFLENILWFSRTNNDSDLLANHIFIANFLHCGIPHNYYVVLPHINDLVNQHNLKILCGILHMEIGDAFFSHCGKPHIIM
jgi:hypothetical protein